jgi:hypothetical protein
MQSSRHLRASERWSDRRMEIQPSRTGPLPDRSSTAADPGGSGSRSRSRILPTCQSGNRHSGTHLAGRGKRNSCGSWLPWCACSVFRIDQLSDLSIRIPIRNASSESNLLKNKLVLPVRPRSQGPLDDHLDRILHT